VVKDTARPPVATPARYRQDRLQYTAPLANAQCRMCKAQVGSPLPTYQQYQTIRDNLSVSVCVSVCLLVSVLVPVSLCPSVHQSLPLSPLLTAIFQMDLG